MIAPHSGVIEQQRSDKDKTKSQRRSQEDFYSLLPAGGERETRYHLQGKAAVTVSGSPCPVEKCILNFQGKYQNFKMNPRTRGPEKKSVKEEDRSCF